MNSGQAGIHGSTEASLGTSEGEILRVEEAARLLRIGRNQCYDAIARGELPAVRIGKSIRLSRTALERWMAESNKRVPGPIAREL